MNKTRDPRPSSYQSRQEVEFREGLPDVRDTSEDMSDSHILSHSGSHTPLDESRTRGSRFPTSVKRVLTDPTRHDPRVADGPRIVRTRGVPRGRRGNRTGREVQGHGNEYDRKTVPLEKIGRTQTRLSERPFRGGGRNHGPLRHT